jgi:hypothetical protein
VFWSGVVKDVLLSIGDYVSLLVIMRLLSSIALSVLNYGFVECSFASLYVSEVHL